MKKPSTWAAIIGGILIATYLFQGATLLTHPTDLPLLNIAVGVTDVLWLCLGVFLIAIFLKSKQKDDSVQAPVTYEPDSAEDIASLGKKRNWIFGFVLIVGVIGASSNWILNDYTAGLTLINIEIIFDLVLNAILFYLAVELFRGTKNVLNALLYTIIVYVGVEAVIDGLRHFWSSAVIGGVFALYFLYAIKAPLNRKNHRIAHLIILPVFFVLALALGNFDNSAIEKLSKHEDLLEQQFLNDTGSLDSAYTVFLQKDVPADTDIDNVRRAITNRNEKSTEIEENIQAMKEEYEKQLPSIAQKETFERFKYFLTTLNLNKQQAEKVGELMDYAAGVDFTNLTDQQKADISALKDEVQDFNNKISEQQYKLNDANLNY